MGRSFSFTEHEIGTMPLHINIYHIAAFDLAFRAASTISAIAITASSSKVRPTTCRATGAFWKTVGSSMIIIVSESGC